MKTFDGYSKEKFSDTSVLLAGGGSKELSNFIGTLNWDSTNRKLQYKKIGDTNWRDLVTFGSNATNSTAYLPLAGGTMTGLLTTTSGGSHKGIKVGNTYINAINGDLIFQNNSAIRFGGDSWDYNVWAGLKYVHSSKIIYLGLADGSAFTANSAQSNGKLYLPGIANIYTGNGSNLVWHAGNDGSGSGLDADLLDGVHANGLFTAFSNAGSLTTRITIGGVTKDLKIDADTVDGYNANSFLLRGRMTNPSNGTSYHGAIPYVIALKAAGTPIYTDPEFASGTNSVSTYNNSGNSTVTISRIADNLGSANSSGYILKISTTSGTASPGRGGFYQNIIARQNAVFAQIFRAKIPTGFSVVNAENSMGNGYTTYWLTDTAGTGKWEWYIRITICGNGGTYSGGGHVYLSGSGEVTWYLSYCNVIDLTKGNYDGLRTRYADSAGSVTWANVTGKPTFATVATSGKYSDLSGTPTSLPANGGNADTVDGYHANSFSLTNHTHTFASLTSKPTTLSGYGITDGLYSTQVSAAQDNITWAKGIAKTHRRAFYYNTNGTEYSYLFGFSSANTSSGDVNYGAVLKMGYADSYLRILRVQSGSWKTSDWEKISAGYADKAAQDSDGNLINNTYLKKSGGTLTGALTIKNNSWHNILILDRTNANGTWGPAIQFQYDGTANGTLTMTSNQLYIGDAGSNRYKAWHEGNDGTGSGLDADLLDGKHASDFATSGHNHDNRYLMLINKAGSNTDLNKVGTPGNYSLRSDYAAQWPTANSPISSGAYKLFVLQNGYDGDSTTPKHRTLFAILASSTNMYIRYVDGNGTWSNWATIAHSANGTSYFTALGNSSTGWATTTVDVTIGGLKRSVTVNYSAYANNARYGYISDSNTARVMVATGTGWSLNFYRSSSTIGSSRQLAYLSTGTITAGNYVVSHYGNAGKSNMNDVGRMHASSGMTNLEATGNTTDNPYNGSTESTSWHLYWSTNYTDDPNGSNSWTAQIANKAGTNLWWVRSRSGGTITNGTAWTSGWRHLVTSNVSGVGGSTTPVYVNTNGEIVACTAYSGLFTNLSNSGNNISVTIGGTNKTLTVGYANSSDKSNYLTSRYIGSNGDTVAQVKLKILDSYTSLSGKQGYSILVNYSFIDKYSLNDYVIPTNGIYSLTYLTPGYNGLSYGQWLAASYGILRLYVFGRNNSLWTERKTIAWTSDIPTSLKNPYALTVSLNGTSLGTYDGSAAKNINITPSSIGAASSSHTHSYANIGFVTFTPANGELTPALVLALTGGWSIKKGTWYFAGNGYIKAGDFGNIDLAGTSVLTFGSSDAYTQLYITAPAQSGHSGKTNEIFFYNNHGSDYSPGWTRVITNRNYTDYVNATNFPGLNKTGTVTSVTVTGANGLSGTGTITTSGTITLSNAGVRSTTINGNYLRVNTNGTNADLTIPYATYAKSLKHTILTSGLDLNTLTTEGIYSNTQTTICNSLINGPAGRTNGECRLEVINCDSSSHSLQWLYTKGGKKGEIWYRMGTSDSTWSTWNRIAFTSSDITGNAASATKLQTTRTIWGLNFNGTNNISGALSGATTITASGNITTSGNVYAAHFYESSDIRQKTDFSILNISTKELSTIPLFDFSWKEDPSSRNTGTSAQAVQSILPNLVTESGDYLKLDYGVLGTIAGITACKELVNLKSEIDLLKERIKELELKLKMINDY